MKTVAVLGGGPAGAFAAERLAQAGLKTIVFDEKLAWEKPCGGGLTYKAYHEYPFLIENDTPKRLVCESGLAAPNAGEVSMTLTHPLVIYSRMDLNNMLLKRAELSGAMIEKTRVLGLERRDRGWRLRTQNGTAEADYCIIATGARNPLREVGTEWSPEDMMTTMGYYVPGSRDRIDIEFLPQLHGYMWVFPRCGHLSVGIGAKGEPAHSLRKRLETFMDCRGISRCGATFFAHVLPSLHQTKWQSNRVSGDGWLAVGDAAGLVDPITGEGLFYAMRSGDLASRVLLNEFCPPELKPQAYREMLARDFALDLEFAAALAHRIFLGKFIFESIPKRMVQFVRRSPRFRILMQDLFAGTQPYLTLKGRLLRNMSGTFRETVVNFLRNRPLPARS